MGEHDAAHQAYDARHLGQRHGDDHDDDARLGERDERDGEHDRRNRHHAVHHPHHHGVHRSQVAADETNRQSDQRRERRDRQADDERYATAIDDPACTSRVRNRSVPNQCRAVGLRRRWRARWRSGRRCQATGAAIDTSMIASNSTPPIATVGWRRRNVPMRPRTGATAGTAAVAVTAVMAVIGQYRMRGVEHRIEHVDHEIDDDIRAREHEDDALDHRIVAAQDRVDRQAAEAGDGEHALGDDDAADQQRDADADHRHDRNRGVAQRMPHQYAGGGEAFGHAQCGCSPGSKSPASKRG